IGTPTKAPDTITPVALRSACFHAFGTSGAAATKSMISSSAATRRGAAMLLASGMKNQRGAETGKSARRCRQERDRADRDGGVDADIGRDETGEAHALDIWSMMFAENRVARRNVIRATCRRSSLSP